jgi:hypothetical protein
MQRDVVNDAPLGTATRSTFPQIVEYTIHPSGPVGAVGLLREAISLQNISDLPAGADDLKSDAARDKFAMEVVKHFHARKIDKG